MKKTFIYIILYILLFFNAAFSDEKVLKIPIGDWPPFSLTKEKPYSGIDIDLWNEIEKRLDAKINIKKYPWSRSLSYMKLGKLDAISGIAKREKREEYLKYLPKPYYTCSTVFYVRKGDSHKIKTYDDLKNFTIGYVSNSAYFLKFDNDLNLSKKSVTREIQLIKMLKIKRLNAIIGTDCQVDYELSKLGYTNLIEKAQYKPGNKVDLYIAISKKSQYINYYDTLAKILDDIIKEGKIEEFSRKYQ